jgi:TolB-like protein
VAFVFGDHRLDIHRRELYRGIELIGLEPKVFDLLAFLIQHRNRVVSKDDLLQAVWGGRIVSESALTTRINAVRRALGDDGAAQRLIRTFTRKGIRFVGEVTETRHEMVPTSGGAADAYEPLRPVPPTDKPSIAVLAFQNMSGDPEQEYFADGMVEEITTAIGRSPWLSVIAPNSSFTYKGKAVDVKQVARELGVRYLLKGSVRKAGNRVRITAELIDTTSGAHIWGERFDGTRDDIFELQDQVASSVVGAIEPRLRLAEVERAGRKPTDSLDAYDFCLRAQAQAYKRTRQSLAESIRLSYLALEIDPNYGLAMSRIALSRGMQRLRLWIPPSGPEVEEGVSWRGRQLLPRGMIPGCWISPAWHSHRWVPTTTPRSARWTVPLPSTQILPSPLATAQ